MEVGAEALGVHDGQHPIRGWRLRPNRRQKRAPRISTPLLRVRHIGASYISRRGRLGRWRALSNLAAAGWSDPQGRWPPAGRGWLLEGEAIATRTSVGTAKAMTAACVRPGGGRL